MSTSEHDFEDLLGPSQEERRIIRRNITRLEELQERISRRLAQLHLALGDPEDKPSLSSPAPVAAAKAGAREQIAAILAVADRPITRTEIVQRLRVQKINYASATVHLYLKDLLESGEVVREDAPADSRSTYAYSLKSRATEFGKKNE